MFSLKHMSVDKLKTLFPLNKIWTDEIDSNESNNESIIFKSIQDQCVQYIENETDSISTNLPRMDFEALEQYLDCEQLCYSTTDVDPVTYYRDYVSHYNLLLADYGMVQWAPLLCSRCLAIPLKFHRDPKVQASFDFIKKMTKLSHESSKTAEYVLSSEPQTFSARLLHTLSKLSLVD
jgi:hypothetical protein